MPAWSMLGDDSNSKKVLPGKKPPDESKNGKENRAPNKGTKNEAEGQRGSPEGPAYYNIERSCLCFPRRVHGKKRLLTTWEKRSGGGSRSSCGGVRPF